MYNFGFRMKVFLKKKFYGGRKVKSGKLAVSLGVAAVCAGMFGCRDVVMDQRNYVPASPAPAAEEPAYAALSAESGNGQEAAPAAAPAPKRPEFAPMTAAFNTGTVTSAPAGGSGAAADAGAGSVNYTLRSGDTVGAVAVRYGVKVSAVMRANNLDDAKARKLRAGQTIVIPSPTKTPAANTASAAPSVSSAGKPDTAPAVTGADGSYEIKSGDTPEKIARKFGVKMSDLMKANNLDDAKARRLRIGQKLVIPGKGNAGAASPAAAEAPAPVVSGGFDTPAPVPGGDAPADDGFAAEAAADFGDASDAGETIESYDAVNVENDTTVEAFAAAHNMSVEDVRRGNESFIEPDGTIKSGTVIFVRK